MGFLEPAVDYIGRRLTVDMICGNLMNSRVLEMSGGYAVTDVSLKAYQGNRLLVLTDGCIQSVKMAGAKYGEVIEGSAMHDVHSLATSGERTSNLRSWI